RISSLAPALELPVLAVKCPSPRGAPGTRPRPRSVFFSMPSSGVLAPRADGWAEVVGRYVVETKAGCVPRRGVPLFEDSLPLSSAKSSGFSRVESLNVSMVEGLGGQRSEIRGEEATGLANRRPRQLKGARLDFGVERWPRF